MLWGGELVLRDGSPVGQVTSAAWGDTVGACVGPGLRAPRRAGHPGLAGRGAFEVDVAGERFAARMTLKAPL